MAGEERKTGPDIAALKAKLGCWATGKRQRNLILLLGAVGVVLLAAPTLMPDSQNKPTEAAPQTTAPQEDYAQTLAQRLENTLGRIKGVGEIRVMVTLARQEEYLYAIDQTAESRTEADTTQSQSQQTHVILEQDGDDRPLVTTTVVPQIQGVLVVCAGGSDPIVQSALTQAVTALLNIGPSRVAVVEMGE